MERGRVKADSGLNLREKPNGQVVDVLRHDEEVEVLGTETFYRVKSSSGRLGYVYSNYMDVSPEEKRSNDEMAFFEQTFSDANFIGKSLNCDKDFLSSLEKLAGFAVKCNVQIYVTSSLRSIDNQVNGAIVPPASKSCHHVGHAIDMNLRHSSGFYNSRKLTKAKRSLWHPDIAQFIDLIRKDDILRWGGDFLTQDPVHIDDNLYNRDKAFYEYKLKTRLMRLNG